MGSSIVYGVARSAIDRPGGKHPTIQYKNIAILWFGVRRMKWKDFDSFFESNKLKSNLPPYYLVVHLGSNDLGILPDLELYQNIKCSFLRCKFLVPNMSIIWSDMWPRLYWHKSKGATRNDAMRKDIKQSRQSRKIFFAEKNSRCLRLVKFKKQFFIMIL